MIAKSPDRKYRMVAERYSYIRGSGGIRLNPNQKSLNKYQLKQGELS